MAHFSVSIQQEAQEDLDQAYEFLEKERPGLGFEFLAELTEIIEHLEQNPFLYQSVYRTFRRAIIRRFHYQVIYLIEEKTVIIFAIMHGSRNPKAWQDRGA